MKRPKIFVIQSFSTASEHIFGLIASAAAKVNVVLYRADTIPAGANFIQGIQEAIQSADLIIADVTDANPNVMYEIGSAQAHKKPLILISGSSRSIPFDLASLLVLIYDRDDLSSSSEFINRLSNRIAQALKTPEAFIFPEAETEQDKRQKVFISYSHHDRAYLDRLLIHLKPLEKEGLIDLWIDTRLRPGDRWKKEIENALNKANVAILLVSADFLASDFITANELPPILRNAEDSGTRIIPLIVKPCRFTRDKNLRHFQAINDPSNALIRLPEGEQEMYYDSVAAEVEKNLQRG